MNLELCSYEKDKAYIRDLSSGYSLGLSIRGGPMHFSSVVVHYSLKNRARMIATGREMHDYIDVIDDDPLPTCDQQIVEVGAGFSSFIPELVQAHRNNLSHRPIIIDPLDYDCSRSILRQTLSQHANNTVVRSLSKRIETFIHRCDVLLGRDIVHIQKTLGEALHDDPSLIGSADYVRSMYGPLTHPVSELPDPFPTQSCKEMQKIVRSSLRSLLRDPNSGVLVTN